MRALPAAPATPLPSANIILNPYPEELSRKRAPALGPDSARNAPRRGDRKRIQPLTPKIGAFRNLFQDQCQTLIAQGGMKSRL
jgi:hypothetical protein